MLDTSTKRRKEQQKQRVKKRYNVTIDPENYLFIPAKKQADYYDNDVHQRVAIYVRVSTDDVRQTTSYELQKKYYGKTVFIITTDGMENASRCYSYREVQKMVKHEQEKYGWEFLFLGANMDAIEAARTFGIREDRAVRYECDSAGTSLNFEVVSKTIGKLRKGEAIAPEWSAEIARDYEERGQK